MVKKQHDESVGPGSSDGNHRYNVRGRGLNEGNDGVWTADWEVIDLYTDGHTRVRQRFSAEGLDEAIQYRDALAPTFDDRIMAGDFWPLMAEIYLTLSCLSVSRNDHMHLVSEITKALPHVAESPISKTFSFRYNRTAKETLADTLVDGGVDRPLAEEFSDILLSRLSRRTGGERDGSADLFVEASGLVSVDGSAVCPLTKNGIDKLGELLDRGAMGSVLAEKGQDVPSPAMCAAASWVHLLTGLPLESILSLKAEDIDLAQRKAIVRRKLVPVKTTGDWTCFEANECRPRHCTWPSGLAPVFDWLLSEALPDGWLFYRGDASAPSRLLQEDLNLWASRALRPLLDQLDRKYSANPMKFLRIVYVSTMYDHGHTRYQIESRIGYCSFTRDWPLKEPPKNAERAGALYVTAQECLCSPSPSIWGDLDKGGR